MLTCFKSNTKYRPDGQQVDLIFFFFLTNQEAYPTTSTITRQLNGQYQRQQNTKICQKLSKTFLNLNRKLQFLAILTWPIGSYDKHVIYLFIYIFIYLYFIHLHRRNHHNFMQNYENSKWIWQNTPPPKKKKKLPVEAPTSSKQVKHCKNLRGHNWMLLVHRP